MAASTDEFAMVAMPPARKFGLVARRFLVPSFVVSLYALLRFRAFVSSRAEVELSSNLRLGRGTTVSSFVKIKTSHAPLVTGQHCGFATGCFVETGAVGITLGDHVIFGPNVSVIASNYKYARVHMPLEEQGITSKGIRIGNNVWIGANCVILDGSELGDNTIVVAGSLVNRKFPPNCIVQGNPAKILMHRIANMGDAA
jgi:acetyltransferase-like isoleucine patch superfamily enzyme